MLRALGEEVAVVVLVVLIFLLHARSSLATALTPSFVLLPTFGGMIPTPGSGHDQRLPGGIGIVLGMAVDADVVILTACHRRVETLSARALPGLDWRAAMVAAAASTVAPAIPTSLPITAPRLTTGPAWSQDRSAATSARRSKDTRHLCRGYRRGHPGSSRARSTRARSAHCARVRQPDHEAPCPDLSPVRGVRLFSTEADAGYCGVLAAASCLPDHDSARRRLPATCRLVAICCSCRQRCRAFLLGMRRSGLLADKTLAQFPEVMEAFGQSGTRRFGDRSRAVFDGRDHDSPQGPAPSGRTFRMLAGTRAGHRASSRSVRTSLARVGAGNNGWNSSTNWIAPLARRAGRAA